MVRGLSPNRQGKRRRQRPRSSDSLIFPAPLFFELNDINDRVEGAAKLGQIVRPECMSTFRQDPAICCQRFDPSADINGAKKSSMSDPNADTSAQICPTVRSKVRTHRSVCSEVRSRCGHFWRFIDQVPHPILTSNKTKDEFFFC
jgi:hypothetical protein